MKSLVVLTGTQCGYCKKAKMLINRALEKEKKYLEVNIQYILDESESGKKYGHTLVPAFFCDDEKVYEGNPNMDIIKDLLKKCYRS